MTQRLSYGIPAILAAALVLTGCGQRTASPSPSRHDPVLTLHISVPGTLAATPVKVAETLGFFRHEHLDVKEVARHAQLMIQLAGSQWPVDGYLGVRPDMVLVSPIPDPHFRLRALNNLPMVLTPVVAPSQPLAVKILMAHHAAISRWSTMPFTDVESLWKRHHLPWALVSLQQAADLQSLNSATAILAWLGASTGPIPHVVVAGEAPKAQLTHFLRALNLALWYLNTTPAADVSQTLSLSAKPDTSLTRELAAARHYQYWPATTFPDSQSFERARRDWYPTWPSYSQGVNPVPGRQALAGKGA